LDQAAAAEQILVSVAKISRIETGQLSARPLEVRSLLDLYRVEDAEERNRLETLAKDGNKRGWWLDYADTVRPSFADHISLENDATYIRDWQPALIPGLLQTEEYARAVVRVGPNKMTQERLNEVIQVRLKRQSRIEEGGANFAAIVWEPALAAPAGDADAHRAQLAHLVEVAGRRNVTLQVLPATAVGFAGMSGPFTAFSFSSEPHVEAVTLNNLCNTMVLEEHADLAAYANAFDQLRTAALSKAASIRLIRELAARHAEKNQDT
jgi:hypothetical protein